MSDSGQEETKSRRRHKDDYDSPAKEVRSRRKSYSDDSEDPQPRRRDRSPVRSSNRYRDEDDDVDKDRTRKDRRDQRDGYQKRRYAADDSRRERDYRPRSGSQDRSRHHPRSRSPPTKRRRHSPTNPRSPPPEAIEPRSRAPLPSQAASFRGGDNIIPTTDSAPAEKQKPNYAPTGLLAKEANTISGTTTVLKYHEPPEARKPPASQSWRLYVFAGKKLLDTLHLHTRSAWLLGRDESVVDYVLEDGRGVSKQHAVVQFRYISTMDEFGAKSGRVRPYLIDLESQGGTRLNGERIGGSRFVELVDGDVVAFGEGGREFVVMLPKDEKKEKA